MAVSEHLQVFATFGDALDARINLIAYQGFMTG